MRGDTTVVSVELQNPIAMEAGQRFAIREGGKTVGAGVVLKIFMLTAGEGGGLHPPSSSGRAVHAVHALARHRRVRRASPTRLPDSRLAEILKSVATSLSQLRSTNADVSPH